MRKFYQIFPARVLIWIIVVFLTLTWGSSFIVLKKALNVFDPQQVFAGRMTLATLVLLPFGLREIRKVPRNRWLALVIFALTMNVAVTLLNAIAQTGIDSSLNGILNTPTPMMTLVVGVVFYRQNMGLSKGFGVLLGLIGAIALLLMGNEGKIGVINIFAIFAVLATFCNGFTSNLLKYNLVGMSALQISSVAFMITFPLAFGYALYSGFFTIAFADTEGWVAFGQIAFLAIFANAIALVMLSKLVQLSSPVFASLITYLMPLVALFWGYKDGEIITLFEIFAMILIILSVYVVNRYD